MKPTNYDRAIKSLRLADRQHLTKASDCAMVESSAAQAYATLALVDAIRDMQQVIRDALMDAKGGVK